MINAALAGMVKGFLSVAVKTLIAMGSEQFSKWFLFTVAREIVGSTKNKTDDAFIDRLEKAYDEENK